MKKNVVKFAGVFSFSLLSTIGFSQCVSDTNNIFSFTYNGTIYEIIKENKNWVDAAACADARGGFLAEINSQGEQDAIFSNVNLAGIIASNTVAPDGGNASYLWIGGNDLTTEGEWIWDGDNVSPITAQFWQGTSTGSSVGGLYNNWGNEPDDYNGQDALGFAFTNWPLGVAGQWNDVDATNTLYYIIEYYPSSASLTETSIEQAFLVYPNPSNDKITIERKENIKPTTVKLINSIGAEVLSYEMDSNLISISTDSLESGVYFIQIEGYSTLKKLVIE